MKTANKIINNDFVGDIKTIIKNNDRKKAREILPFINSLNNVTINRCLYEISTAPDDITFFLLNFLLQTKQLPSETKESITELILDKARLNSHFIILFIENAPPEALKNAVPLFANILVTDTDTHILLEVIQAIGTTKDQSCVDVIADFIFYDNDELQDAAVTALEKIGGEAVIKRLSFASTTSKSNARITSALENLKNYTITKQSKNDEKPAEQFAARSDTLEQLSEDSDIVQLLTMLNSSSPHERHAAIDLLIETGVKAIPAVSENINIEDSNSIINGLDILGNINNKAALSPVLKILNTNHKDSNVRFAAYEAISKLPPTESSTSLINGIEDPEEQVRIAAATAINKNLSEILIAGLLSKIETSGKSSKQKIITASIIDSYSNNIFSSLLISDSFVFLASEYLAKAHESTRQFFINILTKRGTKTLARNISENKLDTKTDKSLSIFVVDDSEIMLNYYLKFFHSMKHKPTVFTEPDKALIAIETEKPDLLTTDLNMLNMNGLQLSSRIRKNFNSKELPIIIITTQSDFVLSATSPESNLQSNISSENQINMVLQKPPIKNDFKQILNIS